MPQLFRRDRQDCRFVSAGFCLFAGHCRVLACFALPGRTRQREAKDLT
jgi:hypothetical protein